VAGLACAGLLVAAGVSSSAATVGAARGLGAARPAGARTGNLLTYDYGNGRDGLDTVDASLAGISKRAAWTRSLPGGIYGQPLVIGNQVIVGTEDDVVWGLNGSTGAIEWHFTVGSPVTAVTARATPGLSGCGDIFPLGITGTPVIDGSHSAQGHSEIFVAGEVQRPGTSDWQGIEHVLMAATITGTSATVLWSHQIDPPGAGSTYLIPAEQQRSALTLSGGRIYVDFGGLNGDCGNYQGYVVSMAESGQGVLETFKVPTSREGAIWSTGGASIASGGELFVATGNSANTSSGQPFDYGDAVIGLSPGLTAIDSYFAPSNWYALNAADLDLGSGGPIQLPGGKLIFEIGKRETNGVSTGYLLDPTALGGIGHPLFSGPVCSNGGSVFGADAAQAVTVGGRSVTYVYVPCPSGTVALTIGGSASSPTFSVAWRAPSGVESNGPPILAGGLLWALSTGADGGAGKNQTMYGLSPLTGKLQVDRLVTPVEHFATPAAGDGRVFVAGQQGVEAFAPPAPSPAGRHDRG